MDFVLSEAIDSEDSSRSSEDDSTDSLDDFIDDSPVQEDKEHVRPNPYLLQRYGIRQVMQMDAMYNRLVARKFASVVPPRRPPPRNPGWLIDSGEVQELVFEGTDDSQDSVKDSAVIESDIVKDEEEEEELQPQVSTNRGRKRSRTMPMRKTARKRPMSIATRLRQRPEPKIPFDNDDDDDDDVFLEGTVDMPKPPLCSPKTKVISISSGSDEIEQPLTVPVFHASPSTPARKRKQRCRKRLEPDRNQPLLPNILIAPPIIISSFSSDSDISDVPSLPDIKQEPQPETETQTSTSQGFQTHLSPPATPPSIEDDDSLKCPTCDSEHRDQEALDVHDWCVHEQDTEPVKRKEVTMEMYAWGSVRRFMHLRKCKICEIKIPCFFWIRHLNNAKHVEKVNSRLFVPMFHNRKTFLKDCEETDIPFKLYEKEEPTFGSMEIFTISSDEEPIVKCPRCPRVFHEHR